MRLYCTYTATLYSTKKKKMKIALQLIGLILILNSCNSTQKVVVSNNNGNIKSELIGTWEFEILKNKEGEKVDTIWHGMGHEIPKGPLMTFKEDGTYSKQFTPINIDTGKWFFDEQENAIKFLLYYEKPYDFAAQYLIDKGHATKDENGNYYEVITEKVYELTENKLILIGREERRRRTFKKRNK